MHADMHTGTHALASPTALALTTGHTLRSKALLSSLLPTAPSGRMSILKNLQNLDPSHRISDRDYMGWMDFGRRSAEDYEYPS